jgi:hypothetical protein
MPSYESSMRNLAKVRAKACSPLPWRSSDESRMIQRYVFQWLTCRGTRPSGSAWARSLGISHPWLQKLVRRFQADPSQMLRETRRCGDPTLVEKPRQPQGHLAPQPSTWRGRSKQISLDQVGCKARKIPAGGDVFS